MKTLIKFNASAAKESSCLLRTWYTVIEGYTSKQTSNDVIYGSAYHKFEEILERTGDEKKSILAAQDFMIGKDYHTKPKKDHLNIGHLTLSCRDKIDYNKSNQDSFEILKDTNGEPLVELKFAIPYYVDDFYEVLLCGTIDKIGKFKNGCYALGDIKTTSTWSTKSYFDSYKLSPQLLFYLYAIHWYADNFPDSIFGEIRSNNIGVFIDGVFLKASGKTSFERSSVIYYKQEDLDEFKLLLQLTIERLLIAHKLGVPPNREGMLNGACNTLYGTCKFFDVCSAPDKIAREYILKNNFNKKEYDPLTFGE